MRLRTAETPVLSNLPSVVSPCELPPKDRTTNSVRREQILFSASLSLLFILIYGACNTLASHRQEIGTCFFDWELGIPFVPALIVPYLSIDLFFVASFLLCAERIELHTHARRIALAILIAGIAFLAFPLTVGYQRPVVRGWTGRLFVFLWSFDKPHNLVPSLHVALASLLWPLYARRTHSALRWFVHGWFTLIIASPLLTWQHHVLDVVAGAMLGQVCMFVFRDWRACDSTGVRAIDRALASSATGNLRVAQLYGMGSAGFVMLATILGAWYWVLLWPAVALAVIAIAYVRGNSGVFRKSEGRLPISTRVVLGPYLCGVFVRLLIYGRRRKRWREAAPRVYCGGLLGKREALLLQSMGISGVLDLTAEHAEGRVLLHSSQIEYLNVPVLDLTQPSSEQLAIAVGFIDEHVSRGGVYVHCALGISRSVAVLAEYLESQRLSAVRVSRVVASDVGHLARRSSATVTEITA